MTSIGERVSALEEQVSQLDRHLGAVMSEVLRLDHNEEVSTAAEAAVAAAAAQRAAVDSHRAARREAIFTRALAVVAILAQLPLPHHL